MNAAQKIRNDRCVVSSSHTASKGICQYDGMSAGRAAACLPAAAAAAAAAEWLLGQQHRCIDGHCASTIHSYLFSGSVIK